MGLDGIYTVGADGAGWGEDLVVSLPTGVLSLPQMAFPHSLVLSSPTFMFCVDLCRVCVLTKVVEIRPEPSVTLIDTDVEIELDLPDEAREQLEAKDARERAKTLRAHMDPAPSTASGLSPIAASGSPLTGHTLSPAAAATSTLSPMKHDDLNFDPDDEEEAISKDAFDPEKHQLAKLQALPEEPSKDEEGVFTCQLRSLQGKVARRFRHEDSLGLLLDFAEAHGGIPGHYRVVIPFPRKELTREDALSGITLKAAGLTSRQEAVILERF